MSFYCCDWFPYCSKLGSPLCDSRLPQGDLFLPKSRVVYFPEFPTEGLSISFLEIVPGAELKHTVILLFLFLNTSSIDNSHTI